jgi:hypothetical protein
MMVARSIDQREHTMKTYLIIEASEDSVLILDVTDEVGIDLTGDHVIVAEDYDEAFAMWRDREDQSSQTRGPGG